MPHPSGNIAVVDARLQNISGGMQWNMQQAEDIRFLAVSGTITIGASRARYDFTLVEYHLHIDEVPWIIFSTLGLFYPHYRGSSRVHKGDIVGIMLYW